MKTDYSSEKEPVSSPSSKRMYVFQLLTVFIGFLIFGFSENVKGPAIPRIQLDMGLDGLLRGLQAGYGFIGLCALLCCLSALPLYRYLKKRGELL